MNGYLAFFLTFLTGVIVAVAGEFLSEEVRDRLDQVPQAILRLAARWLDPSQRVTVYREEWDPELTYILKGTEARPVTRLITGTRYALGILISTRRIARHLHRPAPGQPDLATAGAPVATGGYRFRAKRGRLLVALAGAHAEILELCPSERIRFQSLGYALLITSGVASFSMWFALSSDLGVNAIIAAALALLWGLVIMGIDRWLVTSLPVDGTRKMLMAAPRLLLAVLLGTVISVPLVLRIFQSEINAEITAMSHQQTAAVSNLREVIASRGAVAISLPADPQVRSLTGQLAVESSLQQASYQLWQCLSHGGPGCPAENNLLAAAAETTYNHVSQRAAVLGSELRQARYQQAVAELPAAISHQAAPRATPESQTPGTSGLLVRLQALNNLSAGNDTLSVARWLLLLLFVVIECLALTVKLLQRRGNYEAILIGVEREIHDARRALGRPRVAVRRGPNVGPAADPAEQDAGGRAGDLTRRVAESQEDSDIWRGRGGPSKGQLPLPGPRRHEKGLLVTFLVPCAVQGSWLWSTSFLVSLISGSFAVAFGAAQIEGLPDALAHPPGAVSTPRSATTGSSAIPKLPSARRAHDYGTKATVAQTTPGHTRNPKSPALRRNSPRR